MKELVSIRMRASKEVAHNKIKSAQDNNIHISGAEGLYKLEDINKVVKDYIERALNHSRGKPDRIVITIENIAEKPLYIRALPVTTLRIKSIFDAEIAVKKLLLFHGISLEAISTAFEILHKENMRGASLISFSNSKRLEYDKQRGIRVSRLGISKEAKRKLSQQLSKFNINNDTVKEALILASKVASSGKIIAEVCISDDPDYTTGYVASSKLGYLRIPNIKKKNSRSGGRVFFVKESENIEKIISYLEKTPVIINKISHCRGTLNLNEIIGIIDK
ncbi:MAG: 6-carboxyhexanoate--CoA ligase [Nitrospirae bacterium]|nr:6-carboxyhexanoate--CoA ligase [Nitrospirota bacterium]